MMNKERRNAPLLGHGILQSVVVPEHVGHGTVVEQDLAGAGGPKILERVQIENSAGTGIRETDPSCGARDRGHIGDPVKG